jgi:GDP-L-fucose synthase
MGSFIAKTAQVVAKVLGYKGVIQFELSKPDGSLRKTINSSQLNSLRWWSKVILVVALVLEYQYPLDLFTQPDVSQSLN